MAASLLRGLAGVFSNPNEPTPSFTPVPGPHCGPTGTALALAIPDAFDFDDGQRVSFAASCQAHDKCYARRGGKAECDAIFGDDLRAACAQATGAPARFCINVLAEAYSLGVAIGGKRAYDGTGEL